MQCCSTTTIKHSIKMTTIKSLLFSIFPKSKTFHRLTNATFTQTRNSSYQSSKFLVDVEITTKYETTKEPEDWKYVERILPIALVPEPKQLPEYQSGWKPPGNHNNSPYFVGRTRNHMMPVYLDVRQRGVKRHTIIRKIQGDIWQFEKDLRAFLEDLIKPKQLRLQVNEFAAKICINGDHVNAVKYWLGEKNF